MVQHGAFTREGSQMERPRDAAAISYRRSFWSNVKDCSTCRVLFFAVTFYVLRKLIELDLVRAAQFCRRRRLRNIKLQHLVFTIVPCWWHHFFLAIRGNQCPTILHRESSIHRAGKLYIAFFIATACDRLV